MVIASAMDAGLAFLTRILRGGFNFLMNLSRRVALSIGGGMTEKVGEGLIIFF